MIPATSPDSAAWRTIPPLASAAQRDGFSRNGSDVHVWTRHLSYFGLMLDGEAQTAPRDLAGVVAEDGLTLRWIPGTDASGQMGNVTLYVNGEPYGEFGPTELSKAGCVRRRRRRNFGACAEGRAAGNVSPDRPATGRACARRQSLAEATAALGAASFTLGSVTETIEPTVPPRTVVRARGDPARARVEPDRHRRRAGRHRAADAACVLHRRLEADHPEEDDDVRRRIKVAEKPAQVTVTLRDAKQRRLHTWKLRVKAGANIVRLRLDRSGGPCTR